LTKTNNQELIDRKIAGAEAAIKPQSSHVVSTLDQVFFFVILYIIPTIFNAFTNKLFSFSFSFSFSFFKFRP
jgi:hypothetical protein